MIGKRAATRSGTKGKKAIDEQSSAIEISRSIFEPSSSSTPGWYKDRRWPDEHKFTRYQNMASLKIGENESPIVLSSENSPFMPRSPVNPGFENKSPILLSDENSPFMPRSPVNPGFILNPHLEFVVDSPPTLLELFEKETYMIDADLIDFPPKHREHSERLGVFFPDPDNLSDYDDDHVIVPEGVDPVKYKKRRRQAVAADRFLDNFIKRSCEEIIAEQKAYQEMAAGAADQWCAMQDPRDKWGFY